ncbi:MAG: hypothetical protein AAB403_10265 [Planctomycetota bacterium]
MSEKSNDLKGRTVGTSRSAKKRATRRQKASGPVGATPPTPQKATKSPAAERLTALSSRFKQWWRTPLPKWWTLAVGLLAVVQAPENILPRIDIQAIGAFNEKDPTATLFRVTNVGRWSISDIKFGCSLTTSSFILAFEGPITFNNEILLAPASRLPSGASLTRECPGALDSRFSKLNINDMATIRMSVVASYAWMLPWPVYSKTQHFSSMKSPDGAKYILAPDVRD